MQVSQISAKTASPSTKISCLCTLSEIREINFVKTFQRSPKLLIFIHLPDGRTRLCSVLLETLLLTLKVEIIGIKNKNATCPMPEFPTRIKFSVFQFQTKAFDRALNTI